MGMFDEVSIVGDKIKVEGVSPEVLSNAVFQTKNLDRALKHYIIDEEGFLLEVENEERDPFNDEVLPGSKLDMADLKTKKVDYSGDMRLIESYELEDGVRIFELILTFEEGHVKSSALKSDCHMPFKDKEKRRL